MYTKQWTLRRGDEGYPALLNELPDAPPVLYGRGDPAVLSNERMVAVVGSRKASAYGLSATTDIVAALAGLACTTVSGLAFGIDAATHARSVDARIPTIAVLGGPVEEGEIHPKGNAGLAASILANGGAVISEYPPGTTIHKSFFPARNRIIAGLSQATIVVEATRRSGALITARLALDYNREVLAVPGSIYADQSAGTNDLIAKGAIPIPSCQLISNTIEYALNYNTGPNDIISRQWSMEEQLVLAVFTEARSLDEAQRRCTLPASQFLSQVTALVLASALIEIGDHTYKRNNST